MQQMGNIEMRDTVLGYLPSFDYLWRTVLYPNPTHTNKELRGSRSGHLCRAEGCGSCSLGLKQSMQGHSNMPGLNVGNVRCAALSGPPTYARKYG